jgi:hypothetical protein
MAAIDYTPPPTVRDFIKHYLPGELFYDWIIGPVGSGKTTGLFFKLVYMAGLQEPSPIDGIRRSRAVVVRNTMPQLKDTTLVSWNYWFKDGQAGKWFATENKFLLRFGDVECEVLFRPLDTPDDVARVLSLEVTFALIDEFVQIPNQIIEALAARLGRYPSKKDGGATNWGMWGSSNPGNEDDWWFDYLQQCIQMSDGVLADLARADQVLSGGRVTNGFYFEQPSGFSDKAENIANLPGERGYYTNLAKGKSEAWVNQFIRAMWGFSLNGTPVLTSFNRDLHVARLPLGYNPRLTLIGGYDPGMNGALILMQQDFDGRLAFLDEIITTGMGATRMVDEKLMPLLRNKYPALDWRDKLIIVPDPAAASRTPTDERTVVQVLKQKKLKVDIVDANNRFQPRLEAIEHFTTRLIDGKPALQIDPGCKVTIRAYTTGWRYTVVRKGDGTSPEPEKNKWSHPADAGCYGARFYYRGHMRQLRQEAGGFRPPRTFGNAYHFR